MKKLVLPKKQKGIFAILGFIAIVAIIATVALVILLGQRQPRGITVPITPSQLVPAVSFAQARATICNVKKEGLFAEACQEKFNVVGKDDKELLAELFALFKRIQDDKSLSDYDKLLLGQVVFASLPTKDSLLSKLDHSLLAHLRDFLKIKNIIYAQDLIMSEEEFKTMMTDDLKGVMDLPKGNNAWVINVMVSEYQWINGVRQPIYADQYLESYDPYPGVSTEAKDESKILYNVRSIVGSRATSQKMFMGPFKGTGKMTLYSFTIMSWYSPPYGSDSVLTKAEAGPDAKYLTSRQDRSEENYSGENLLSDLLNKVKMPSREQPKKGENKITLFGGSSNELDCQKFWESLDKEGNGLTIGGPRSSEHATDLADWKFSSKKQKLGKVSGDSCDYGGVRYDTDSEGEAKNGFDFVISYFPSQEEAGAEVRSLQAGEEVKVENKNVSGDTYSMRTVKLTSVEGRPHYLADGNFGRTVGRVGGCVVTLTHTWYAQAYQWNTGDVYERQVGLMDMIMEGTKEGWKVLSETKDLQQFCGGG